MGARVWPTKGWTIQRDFYALCKRTAPFYMIQRSVDARFVYSVQAERAVACVRFFATRRRQHYTVLRWAPARGASHTCLRAWERICRILLVFSGNHLDIK